MSRIPVVLTAVTVLLVSTGTRSLAGKEVGGADRSGWNKDQVVTNLSSALAAGSPLSVRSPGAAVVDSVFPRNVAANFTNSLIITGSHFSTGTTVTLKNAQGTLTASSVEVNDDHTLTATVPVPATAKGRFDLLVRTADGAQAELASAVDVVDAQTVMQPLAENGSADGPPIASWPNDAHALGPDAVQASCPEPYGGCSYADPNGNSVVTGATCSGPADYDIGRNLNYYWQDPHTGVVIGQNCPVGFKVVPVQLSGGHCHTDPNRPGNTFSTLFGYNTGSDGLHFVVSHKWSQAAGQLAVYFWSTQPTCPFYNDSTTIKYILCVAGQQLFSHDQTQLVDAKGFTLKPGSSIHPDNYWGIPEMNAAWVAAAAEFADGVAALPNPQTLVITEMNLEWGGAFDLDANWQSPRHCGHRAGMELDLRSSNLVGQQKQLFEFIARHHHFIVGYETKKVANNTAPHYHLKYNGPDTYRGPGSTVP